MCDHAYFLVIFLTLCAGFSQTRRLGNLGEKHSLLYNMDHAELKRIFGTTDLRKVPEYEITHPLPFNEKGNIESEELARVQTRSRQGRNIPHEENESRYYSLKVFGSNFLLNLTRNKVLGSGFVVENRHENGSRLLTTPQIENHFTGNVVSYPGSIIFLSVGSGLTGIIKLPEATFYLQPLSESLAHRYRRSDSSHPHIIVKENSDKRTATCDVEDFSSPVVERRSTVNNSAETSDPLNSHKYLQTVYVVDQYLSAYLGQSTLEILLPTVANIVAGLFRDDSFGAIKLNYVLKKIIFLNNSELSYPVNASTHTKFTHIKQWAAENNAASDEDPDHFDTVTLLSRGNIGGRGVQGTICTSSLTANVVNWSGLNTAVVIAHEVFHNIGYYHDGTDECPDKSYIMSTTVSAGPASFTWSNCSRDFVQSFLSSGASNCFDDPPLPTRQWPTVQPLLSRLPGVVYDADKQCEYTYATSEYKKCPGSKQTQCDSLYCTRDYKTCHTNYAPPLDGTRCGIRHWCIRGVCVDDGSPLIDGGWGTWSNYSDCTKDCDIGVSYQLRTCDNPSPQNGGQSCEGNTRGNYKTCNTQECPDNSVSFRQMQCSAKGEYSAYIVSSDRCSLVCRSGSSIYWLGLTIDGTRCSNKKEDFDVCIEGHCKDVGCDYSLGTGRTWDRCKVCGGDGSSCELNIVNYTKVHLKYGDEKADLMVTLPVHSTNVVAMQKTAAYNTIGVQTVEGEYLIVNPTWSKTIEAAGTTITYIHEDNKYLDRIYIPGPTQYEINLVFIYYYERYSGVDISYYAPVEGVTSSKNDFEWLVSDWSACSRTCAGGLRTRGVLCVRKDDKTDVGYEYCDELTKPKTVEACTTQPCPPEWFITAWQTCSLSCGKGFQERSVLCRQKIAENEWNTITNETLCAETKPVVSPVERNCNEVHCPPEYVAGQWSECSTTCSRGVMTRQLTCQRRTAAGATEHLPNLWCEDYGSMKPSVTENCNIDSPCEPPPQYEIGCFVLDVNIFPTLLENFQESLDYDNVLVTARSCARLAFHQNYRYFGLANKGECRVGSDMKANYLKSPTSEKCSSFVGQTDAIYVYTLDELPAITPLGCYKDTRDRAMPVNYKNFRNQIKWYFMKKTVNQCAHVAFQSGYKYFGVQFYGECWSGPTANETYNEYGESTNCWKGVGKDWTNFVYKFN